MHFNTAQVKVIPEVIDYKGVAAEGKDLGGGRGREDHRSQKEEDCQCFPFFSSFFTAFLFPFGTFSGCDHITNLPEIKGELSRGV